MSEIPFVNRLGDAIEKMAVERTRRRRRYVRRVTAAVGAFCVVVAGVATASTFLSDGERLVAGGVECYEKTSDFHRSGAQPVVGGRSPVEACSAMFGDAVARVACVDGPERIVAVIPGKSSAACERLGLAALPTDYGQARERFRALERNVAAMETSGCIPPREFAQRLQALLDRTGWIGWTARLRLDVEDGPCGYARGLTGDDRLTLEGSLNPGRRHVYVYGGSHR
jgi:hypothetical protein